MSEVRASGSTAMGPSDSLKRAKSTIAGENKNNDSGWATLEEHTYFRTATLVVIVLNAAWIAIDTQWNHSRLMRADGKLPLEPFSLITEHAFCAYFSLELVIRFFAMRRKCRWFRDPWFVFDLFLVLFMVLETWILPIVQLAQGGSGSEGALAGFSSFRLLRLLRLTRMAKLMRFFPELLTLIKSIASATQAVFFILVFLIGVIYVFAIIFTTQISPAPHEPVENPDPDADPTAKELFSDIGSSMMTLFTNGVLGDNLAQTVGSIKDENLIMMWLFLVFFIISSITLLNMLVGVLCEVIENSSREEVEQSQTLELRSTLTKAFKKADLSRDGFISETEWGEIKQNKDVRALLEKLGVEESQIDGRLDKMQEVVFGPDTGEKKINFEEFVNKIIELRWDTPARALDVEVLKNVVMKEDLLMAKKLEQLEYALQQLANSPVCTPREHMSAIGGQLLDRLTQEEDLEKPLRWLKEVPDDFLLHVLRSRD